MYTGLTAFSAIGPGFSNRDAWNVSVRFAVGSRVIKTRIGWNGATYGLMPGARSILTPVKGAIFIRQRQKGRYCTSVREFSRVRTRGVDKLDKWIRRFSNFEKQKRMST